MSKSDCCGAELMAFETPICSCCNEHCESQREGSGSSQGVVMMNDKILKLIEERIEKGKREYADQIDPFDGRNWEKEALEEILDGMVYIATALIKLKNEKGK